MDSPDQADLELPAERRVFLGRGPHAPLTYQLANASRFATHGRTLAHLRSQRNLSSARPHSPACPPSRLGPRKTSRLAHHPAVSSAFHRVFPTRRCVRARKITGRLFLRLPLSPLIEGTSRLQRGQWRTGKNLGIATWNKSII